MKHSLDDVDSSDNDAFPPKKKAKPPSLQEILDEFGPITSVTFDPFKCEPPRLATATLPPSFPVSAHPFDYFTLFFTPALLQIITSNTNHYANLQRMRVKQERAREWHNIVPEEIYVFLGVLIHIGIHKEPRIDMY